VLENVEDEFIIYQKIPAETFADADNVTLRISTDHSYIPAKQGLGSDDRNLGVMFKTIYFN